MSFEAESNLSVFEAQTSDELSFEELESVAGGNEFLEGVTDTCKKWLRTDDGPNFLRHMGNEGKFIGNILHRTLGK